MLHLSFLTYLHRRLFELLAESWTRILCILLNFLADNTLCCFSTNSLLNIPDVLSGIKIPAVVLLLVDRRF